MSAHDEINTRLRRAAGRLPADAAASAAEEESGAPASPSPGGIDAGARGDHAREAVDMNELIRDGARRQRGAED